MANRTFGGVLAALMPPMKAKQPAEGSSGRPWGRGPGSPGQGRGFDIPWYLPTNTGYWLHDRYNSGNNQGSAVYNPVTPGTMGPLDTPVPYTDPAFFMRVGNGYPGILPDQRYESVINDGPRPESYRRYLDCRIMDTTPNRVGGGTSAGNDNNVVMWSLAGQLFGRPPSALISQPGHNQQQGVGAIPSVYARRTVG